ncbi:MAG: adenylosuccinate synthetase [Candidatus Polarisedimenticolaceae bacterium]|nr:adenylosuccinate synthetase [Candidatus Polarisedimenticolaceae bacterium]
MKGEHSFSGRATTPGSSRYYAIRMASPALRNPLALIFEWQWELQAIYYRCTDPGIALTKLDVLDGLETLKICVAYKLNGEEITTPPAGADLFEQCEPIYIEMPGWQDPTVGAQSIDLLPQAARNYLDKLEELCGVPIHIISTGPDRKETMVLTDPFSV